MAAARLPARRLPAKSQLAMMAMRCSPPLVAAAGHYVLAAGKVHADDTPVRVRAAGEALADRRIVGFAARASAIWLCYCFEKFLSEQCMRVITSDLGEAIAAVEKVYCPHTVKVLQGNRGIDAVLEAHDGPRRQAVSLRYAAPVRIDAGSFDNLLLFMSCIDGSAHATQGRRSVGWSKGQTLPLSPNLSSRLDFDRYFSQNSIRLDKAFVEQVCASMIGRPVEAALCFELVPFAPSLEGAWHQMVNAVELLEAVDLPVRSRARQHMDELLAALVLESHPHNYSGLVRKESKPTSPRVVREAEQLMNSFGAEITVCEIARELRISLRSLELGFRRARNMTPTEVHRDIRLRAAREELLNPAKGTTVTSVATAHGFAHLARFSGYYRAAFGELPGTTLRRNRPAS